MLNIPAAYISIMDAYPVEDGDIVWLLVYLIPNVSFICSRTFLTFRHDGNDSVEHVDSRFVDVSLYGNYQLLTHIYKSFFKTITDELYINT